MSERRRSQDSTPDRTVRPVLDEQLLARAAEINDAIAGEFDITACSPLENPLIERMAELGVETNVAVHVAIERAHRIAFHMRHGRPPRDVAELLADARGLSGDERARVAALAVSWWDGMLTVLRACELDRGGREG